jgi:hypothetical protein
MPLKDGITMARQPEEVEHAVVYRLGGSEEVAAVHNVQPICTELLLQRLELIGVLTPRAVGVVLVAVTQVVRFSHDSLGLTANSIGLELERSLEGLVLETSGQLVGMA